MSKEDVNDTSAMETQQPSASTTCAEKGSQSMPSNDSKADLSCQSSDEAGADEKTTTVGITNVLCSFDMCNADPFHQPTANNGSTQDTTTSTPIDSSQEGAAGTTSSKDNHDTASSSWTAVWDPTSQAYYWWNMITYETTWENPYEKKVVEEDNKKLDESSQQEEVFNNNNNTTYPYAMATYPMDSTNVPSNLVDHSYTYQAYFNKRTGKFQMASDVDRLNPERMSIENRAKRQMQYYFDVDAYTEQRNRERAAGIPGKVTKRHLTKKDIERFKKAKQEKRMKRAREWLCD